MLDPRISTLARERIEIAVEERWTPLAMETSRISSEFAMAGRTGSGIMYLRVLELYKNELDIQVSMAWGQVHKVLVHRGVQKIHPCDALASPERRSRGVRRQGRMNLLSAPVH
jgi:hypothetical protein